MRLSTFNLSKYFQLFVVCKHLYLGMFTVFNTLLQVYFIPIDFTIDLENIPLHGFCSKTQPVPDGEIW